MVARASRVLLQEEYQDLCPITRDSYEDIAKRGELVSTKCGHKFSYPDIKAWLSLRKGVSSPCPACRCPINHRFTKVVIATDTFASSTFQPKTSPNRKSSRIHQIKNFNNGLNNREALRVALRNSRILVVEAPVSVARIVSDLQEAPLVNDPQPHENLPIVISSSPILCNESSVNSLPYNDGLPSSLPEEEHHENIEEATNGFSLQSFISFIIDSIESFLKFFRELLVIKSVV